MPIAHATVNPWGSAKHFRYQAQVCRLTLRQAAHERLLGHPEAVHAEDKLSAVPVSTLRENFGIRGI
jgi:hypothetical protein